MILRKNAQLTPIELSLAILLVMSSFVYLNFSGGYESYDRDLSVDSFMDSIYYSDDFRELVLSENLVSSFVLEDWSDLLNNISTSFGSYKLIVSNNSLSKEIADTCSNNDINYYVTQRIFSVINESDYEFRFLTLGVCY